MMERIICFTLSLGSGGAERQLVYLATLLKDSGKEVMFLTCLPDNFYKEKLDKANVSHICIDGCRNNWSRFWVCMKIIKEFKADVVISYLEMPAFMTCWMKVLGCKFKLIVSERSTTQKKTWFDKLRFPLMKFADYIVPNSFSQARFIEKEYSGVANKVRTITNCVDTTAFSPNTIEIKKEGNINILTVARIHPEKNILRYIEAASQIIADIPDVIFKWYGSVRNEAYYNECQKKIKQLHLENKFLFEQPTTSIVDAYHSASVFCLPSLYEGFPNVICEAMSCGLPIVCSDVCDNPLIVESGENGYLFNPLSIEDMAIKIKSMIELPSDKITSMSNTSRSLALNKFSQKAFLANYLNLIEG